MSDVKDNFEEDLFASDDEEVDLEKIKKRQKLIAEYEEKKKKKPVVIARSAIVLEIKPYDAETNMDQLKKEVSEIFHDGLEWKTFEFEEIAFGIKKLKALCHIEDDKVSTAMLEEEIEDMENVQSVDIASFNKL